MDSYFKSKSWGISLHFLLIWVELICQLTIIRNFPFIFLGWLVCICLFWSCSYLVSYHNYCGFSKTRRHRLPTQRTCPSMGTSPLGTWLQSGGNSSEGTWFFRNAGKWFVLNDQVHSLYISALITLLYSWVHHWAGLCFITHIAGPAFVLRLSDAFPLPLSPRRHAPLCSMCFEHWVLSGATVPQSKQTVSQVVWSCLYIPVLKKSSYSISTSTGEYWGLQLWLQNYLCYTFPVSFALSTLVHLLSMCTVSVVISLGILICFIGNCLPCVWEHFQSQAFLSDINISTLAFLYQGGVCVPSFILF